jgi:hypothetical protein
MAYQYLPLEDNHIRLMLLHAGQDERSPVQIELYHVKFDFIENEQYEALSYVWGEPTFYQTIYTPDGYLKITPGLEQTLKALRKPNSTRTIWIDAICIDQINEDEKCRQIPLMGDVFERATRVVAWMGKQLPGDDPEISLSNFLNVNLHFRPTIDEHGFLKINSDSAFPNANHGSLSSDGLLHGIFQAAEASGIVSLFENPWFTRIWTFQEMVVAKDFDSAIRSNRNRLESICAYCQYHGCINLEWPPN